MLRLHAGKNTIYLTSIAIEYRRRRRDSPQAGEASWYRV